jgi:hypothetical protein
LKKSAELTLNWVKTHAYDLSIGIGRGNPGIFQGYPDPDLLKPIPMLRVWVSVG